MTAEEIREENKKIALRLKLENEQLRSENELLAANQEQYIQALRKVETKLAAAEMVVSAAVDLNYWQLENGSEYNRFLFQRLHEALMKYPREVNE